MPTISALFLTLALVLAVLIGPQTRPWTWGPAMLALGMAVIAALPVIWKRGRAPADFGLMAFGALTLTWFAWRAWISPVAEFGQADLLLMAAAVGAFISVRAISGNRAAEGCLIWGIALLLLANLVVMGKQYTEPTFTPIFNSRAAGTMVGFFGHYIETANFLVASSMLVGAAALFGTQARTVRVLFFLIAVAGLAGVWFTRSRGGILGAATACGVFAAISLIIAKRRRSRWFGPGLIAIPLIGLAIGGFLFMGWHEAQELRRAGSGIAGLLDNDCRLYFLGMAMSCIGLHPIAGGGSRSFSWECFRFVDGKAHGNIVTHKPEMVHNELVQSATDYGLLGTGLLVGFIAALAIATILRLLFEEPARETHSRQMWFAGALAALAGMLVQSSFSFVFHLIPSIILLGICLGMMSASARLDPGPGTTGVRLLLLSAAFAVISLLLPYGWKGSQVVRVLWPAYFSKTVAATAETKIDSITEALDIWPLSSLYQERAVIFQSLTSSSGATGYVDHAERAQADYGKAFEMHSFDPGLAINRANLLSQLQQDSEAEEWYFKAIELQGGMERAFRGHYSLAVHLLGKGRRQFDPEKPEPAHETLETSAEQIEAAVKVMYAITGDMIQWPRVSIHESLGTAREATGDRAGALESYDFASELHNGTRAHYRAGVLIGKMAVEAWSKRQPAEAMAKFIEARRRVGLAKKLPEGVTPSERAEYIAYLDRTIAFLKGAKVEPAKAE